MFVKGLNAMNQFPARVPVCKFIFACVMFMSWSVAATAADAGVLRFVQASPPGFPAPAAISENFSDAQRAKMNRDFLAAKKRVKVA